jgi:hypothetical protein
MPWNSRNPSGFNRTVEAAIDHPLGVERQFLGSHLIIARSTSDDAIQCFVAYWVASLIGRRSADRGLAMTGRERPATSREAAGNLA